VGAVANKTEKWPYLFIKRGENHAYKCLLCGAVRDTKTRKNRFSAQRHVVSLKFDNHAEWLRRNPWARKVVNSASESNPIDETLNDNDEEEETEEQSNLADDTLQSDERVDDDSAGDENDSAGDQEEDTAESLEPTKA
jgi:hypothetical protein